MCTLQLRVVLLNPHQTTYFLVYRKTCPPKNDTTDQLRLNEGSSEEEDNLDDLVAANESANDSAAEDPVFLKKHQPMRSLIVNDYDGDSACGDNGSGDSVCDNEDSDDARTFDSLEANEAYSRVVHSVKLPTRKTSVDSLDSEQDSSWIQSPEQSADEHEEQEVEEEVEETKKEDVPKKPPRMYMWFILIWTDC